MTSTEIHAKIAEAKDDFGSSQATSALIQLASMQGVKVSNSVEPAALPEIVVNNSLPEKDNDVVKIMSGSAELFSPV